MIPTNFASKKRGDLRQSGSPDLNFAETFFFVTRELIWLANVEAAFTLICHNYTPLFVAQCPSPLFGILSLASLAQKATEKPSSLLFENKEGRIRLPSGIDQLLLTSIHIHDEISATIGYMSKSGGFAPTDIKRMETITAQAGIRIRSACQLYGRDDAKMPANVSKL